MRIPTGFLMGLLLGTAISTTFAQGTRLPGMDGVNHAMLYVENMDDAKKFFIEKFGFSEAFTNRDAQGKPTLTYMQASRNTFIELQPAGEGRPVGINHVGLQVEDIKATVAALRQRGLEVQDPRTSSTNSMITNVAGPGGVRFEISELTPTSLQRKAVEGWK
jgi:catechol 2,3-dioxygenase-like lactoylglutathione lyase family enzyme